MELPQRIRALIQLQSDLGFQGEEIDAYLGPNTYTRAKNAGTDQVKELQRILGVPQTGVIDKATKAAGSASNSDLRSVGFTNRGATLLVDAQADPLLAGILSKIGLAESGNDPNAVNIGGIPKKFSDIDKSYKAKDMTIDEAFAATTGKNTGASGLYQNMPAFLRNRAIAAGIDPATGKYDENAQRAIAEYLIKQANEGSFTPKRAYEDPKGFARDLGGIWAGVPIGYKLDNQGNIEYDSKGNPINIGAYDQPGVNAATQRYTYDDMLMEINDYYQAAKRRAMEEQRRLIGEQNYGILQNLPKDF
jgi:hypothetical protein